MQYILTQEELDALVPKAELERQKKAIAAMRLMIVPEGQCIHDVGHKGFGYCDKCPLSSTAHWDDEGKRPISYELSKLMCDKPRSYSK